MSELSSEYVYQGYWVNLSQGSIMGRTITTDTKTGTIIVALLAVFTALGSNHLWHVLTFALHQLRANGREADGLRRQQQALLRSHPSPATLMLDSLKLFFAWRRTSKDQKSLALSIVQALAALLFASSFLAAGIFSSSCITGSDIEVLVKSPFCGSADTKLVEGDSEYSNKVQALSEQYFQNCYSGDVIAPESCKAFIKAQIPLSVEESACPFAPSICASPAVVIDTGLLDLNDVFGLNFANQERMKFRKRTVCSILSQDNHTSIIDASGIPVHDLGRSPLPNEQFMIYEYGTRDDVSITRNSLFGASLLGGNFTGNFGFRGCRYITAVPSENAFEPIPELRVKDADLVFVLVVKNGVKYISPVSDLAFAANQRVDLLDAPNGVNMTLYSSDTLGTVFGCTEQRQMCVNNQTVGEKCTPLQGLQDLDAPAPDIAPYASSTQIEMLKFLEMRYAWDRFVSMRDLELSSMKNLAGFIFSSIPNDQWKREIVRRATINLAAYQIQIPDFAIGPVLRNKNSLQFYDNPPTTEGGKNLCSMQKMRKAGGFVNINVFALSFILAFSAFITLIDLVFLRFLIFLSRFRAALSPRIDRWIQDGVWQLQRRAYEAQNEGVWKHLDREVPVTVNATQLSDLSACTFSFAPVSSLDAKATRTKESKKTPTSSSG